MYRHVNHSIAELASLFDHFQSSGLELEEVLQAHEYVAFVQRWNVFSYKLERTAAQLTLNLFDEALYYARYVVICARRLLLQTLLVPQLPAA